MQKDHRVYNIPKVDLSRINSNNSRDGAISERSINAQSWRKRVIHNQKSNCTLFTKRSPTLITEISEIPQQLRTLTNLQLAEELNKKQMYLQTLIDQIVESEQQHIRQMDLIDRKYQPQIQQMHQILQQTIQKNRQLRLSIQQNQIHQQKKRYPRNSNETLLLDLEHTTDFDQY